MEDLPELPYAPIFDKVCAFGHVARHGSPDVASEQCNALVAFIRDGVRSYATAAILAERERIAAEWERANGFDKHGVADWIRGRGKV